jgi:hypothetical protein
MCSGTPVGDSFNPQQRAARQAAYDAGETTFNGYAIGGPGEGLTPFGKGKNQAFFSKPRAAQGSSFVPDGTGGRTYTPTSVTKSFMPGPSNNPFVRTIS